MLQFLSEFLNDHFGSFPIGKPKAAEQGLMEAQSTLGVMYAQGKGVPRDYATAYMWVNLAAARHDKAKKYLDFLEREATPDQMAEGQKMAREWTATHSK